MSLETLNALRVANGKSPLKAWKESKAKLAEAIAKEGPKTLNVAAKATTEKKVEPKAKVEPKPAKKDKAPKPAKSVATSSGKSTASILKEFGLNPKVGRALLRRHGIERTEAAIVKFLKGRSKG